MKARKYDMKLNYRKIKNEIFQFLKMPNFYMIQIKKLRKQGSDIK